MMAAGVRWCILVTVTLNWLTIAPLNAGPVSINPAISPFGRNIRPITCKSKTGQLGTCMFAMDCTRMNGQHLGTCIDRFYFGSCCAPSDDVAFPAFPSATTEGFNGGNDLGFSSSLPSAPVSPLPTTTTSQHPNILTDLTTMTASSALPTLGVTQTSSAPVTTTSTVASTTVGEVTNPTLAQILASTPLSTLLANPSSSTEAAHTTVQASTQQPAIGTDSPSTSSTVEETTNATTITTTTTPAPTTTIAAIILDITTTTTLSPTTTPEIGTTTATTTTLPSTTVSFAAPQAETTAAAAPTPGLTNPAELTAVGSSSASPVSPEESTATDEPQGDQEDELTTIEPVTDLPSVSLETDVETEIPSITEETVEVTTVGATEEEEEVTKTGPESTDVTQEEVVTGSSLAVQTETQAPITTTTETAVTTPAAVVVVVAEAVTKSPVTSPASPSTTTAVPDTTTAAVPETTATVVVSTSPSVAPETTISFTTASPSAALETTSTTASPTTAAEATTPAPASSSSSPATTTLGPSTSIISEEPSTSQPETSVATTEGGPIVEMTAEPVSNEPTTTPATVSTTLAELNDTIEGPTVQFQNYREVCGRPKYQYPSARIVGGTTTQYGQWPWQVSLRQWRTATFLHKCGAALLNENWAITAAHCVDNVQPDDLLLRMGEYDLATDEEEYPYIERKVQIVASHPQFDSRTFEYDLALLRFYDPVRFQPNIVPICLPPPSEVDFVGRTAYVTGWGRLYEDGPLPSKMQQVSVPVINNTDCENMYRRAGYVEHIPNIFICAGYADGKRDSCEGDSGGPMVIQEEQSWVLAGVISWGIGCAEANQPGVYTRISEFREWIDKIIVF
ncbi:serine protease filzig-like isoform X1 [Daphnia pulicaria]|uniref:serine protease filzig-like isoform X1 n=1 Tax=Daphnia pulicaria TaxID=35523 RepID=UPI001EECBFDC|nr:serine protease filzig-like isoform X1 [Daphnia pulicaria]